MTITANQECQSLEGWHLIQVPSHSDPGRNYTILANAHVNPTLWVCQCRGFSYRGRCSHQEDAIERFCGWSEDKKPQQTEWQRKQKICPNCGGPTRWVMDFDEGEK